MHVDCSEEASFGVKNSSNDFNLPRKGARPSFELEWRAWAFTLRCEPDSTCAQCPMYRSSSMTPSPISRPSVSVDSTSEGQILSVSSRDRWQTER